ncbi:MAG: hypothetical protein QG671_848 [Actinomycetota bacterium]|nr:hypothetical protein [Actinomycetota bacterium]
MNDPLTPELVLRAGLAIARGAEFAFLITSGTGDAPTVRLMQPFPPSDDFTVWLGTSPASRKAAELRANPAATIAYQAPDGTGYVSVQGVASLVTDLEARAGHWREEWQAFFPGGPKGDVFVLVQLVAHRLEVADFARGITPPPYGLKSAAIVRDGAGWRFQPYPDT